MVSFLPTGPRESVTSTIRNIPIGRSNDFDRPSRDGALWVATQVLRAWLRSACPSGTKPFAHPRASHKRLLLGFIQKEFVWGQVKGSSFGDRSNVGTSGSIALLNARYENCPQNDGSQSKPGRLACVGKASRLTSSAEASQRQGKPAAGIVKV
jgi:hypothetical protein